MQTYLLSKGIDSHFIMNYEIDYSEFIVMTNTALTSFYDFIIQVDQGYYDMSEIPFLVNNFASLISVMPVYEKYYQFARDYNNSYSTLFMIG